MNSQNHCCSAAGICPTLQESRSERFNLAVWHPSRWRLLLDALLASPRHIHSYRDLSRRMVEDTLRQKERGDHQ